MIILAVDPGGRTGIVKFDTETRAWDTHYLGGEDAVEHHLDLYESLTEVLREAIRLEVPMVVVCENFFNRGKADAVLISLEYIGIVKLWHAQMSRTHNVKLVMQVPADMQLWDDDKLRRATLWETQKDIRAAKKHLLFYLTQVLHDYSFLEAARRPATSPHTDGRPSI